MAAYDGLIQQLEDKNDMTAPTSRRAAMIIGYLQETVRHYNSDDSIFDDEKEKVTQE